MPKAPIVEIAGWLVLRFIPGRGKQASIQELVQLIAARQSRTDLPDLQIVIGYIADCYR
jgi:hypothetical protein